MGKKRKMRILKRTLKNNKNNFSTVPNIHVIDESVTDTKPSQKSEVLDKICSGSDSIVNLTVKIDGNRKDEVVSKKVKKRKMTNTVNPPEKISEPPTHKSKVTETSGSEIIDDDEANIKDEDIDKFCDELDDADNEQYEAWVKLVEEKLREKK